MDTIKITILEDGSIKMETDTISMENHGGAEMLIAELISRAGGDVDQTSKTGFTHSHDGIFHSH